MPIDRNQARQLLKTFEFRRLFIDHLGWDKYSRTDEKTIDGQAYGFQAVAEKRGVVFLVCESVPDSTTRLKLDKLIAKDHFQHLIVFADQPAGKQLWQWVRRESGKPLSVRTQPFHTSQSGELLLQKLDNLVIGLEEEEEIAHAHVTGRVQAAFDVERVTKRFYERFKAEHDKFLKFIEGIPGGELIAWYASVTINRLMFLYFLQAKGFLDSDGDYLRNKLKQSRDRKMDSYYREFLCPLFFQGFACKTEERPASINKLLGNIPYLNGGLFQRHQIEELHGKKIDIPDLAFQRLFDFFKEYNWHLDERANRDDREINPDVLGYIFEKYINQKQMGAYYTKEDITEYISSNTIIPFLLDATRKDCAVAFDKNGSVWRLLRDNPDRYIHDAVLYGTKIVLPSEIDVGRTDAARRSGWNKPAPPEFGLPTETWREVVERRRRCEEIKAKLTGGEIHEVNDLITYNLNIRQFAQDLIQYSEGPELLRAVFKAVSKISVLDPTCGSGAFLFAALNILRPLYDACLHRMQLFIDEFDSSPSKHPKKFEDLRATLDESRQHPKQDYFILKRIIVDNLYGVDIMEEAVEICKLRLFLKLVAQLEPRDRVEPLPDIDFNIRAGNTLVGYARYEDVHRAIGSKLDFENSMERIEDKAKILDAAVSQFRLQQTRLNGTVTAEDKLELRRRFTELEQELNDFAAAEYGVKKSVIKAWKESHKPFHWFSDFHRIMGDGGFDVIVGNPPWREYAAVKKEYAVRGYTTEASGNLYALCTERAVKLTRTGGRVSFIVQLPLTSSSRMSTVRSFLRNGSDFLTVIPFDDRPGKLFDGLQHCRSVVFTARTKVGDENQLYVAKYQRWPTQSRSQLFPLISYSSNVQRKLFANQFAKIGSKLAASVKCKLAKSSHQPLGIALSSCVTSDFIFYQEATQYWVKATVGLPYYAKNGRIAAPAHGRYLYLSNSQAADAASALMNSSLFYVYFVAFGDCFHLSDTLVSNFPVPDVLISDPCLAKLNKALMTDLKRNAIEKTIQTKDGDEISYSEFFAGASKNLIDEIDRRLAQHYGFTDEELDFIINYDVKYRLGADTEHGE